MVLDKRVNGGTILTGLIGNPVKQTKSPYIHNSLALELGINTIYVPFDVKTEKLEDLLKGFKAFGIRGFNVTVPHKVSILNYLDEISTEASLIGAVNTVLNTEDRLIGYNTDGNGFIKAFKEEISNFDFQGKKAYILGAGGAARAVSVALALNGIDEIHIYNRTRQKAEELGNVISEKTKVRASAVEHCHAGEILDSCDIIINTTSVGMFPDIDMDPLEGLPLKKGQIAYDIIYNPKQTKFLEKAKESGCITVNGFGMLFYQALEAFEIWHGVKIEREIYIKIFNSLMQLH